MVCQNPWYPVKTNSNEVKLSCNRKLTTSRTNCLQNAIHKDNRDVAARRLHQIGCTR